MKRYVLLDSRHESVPVNRGPICEAYDFMNWRVIRTDLWSESLSAIYSREDVELIVTGLTQALTEYLQAYTQMVITHMYLKGDIYGWGKLTLLHYDKDSKLYIPRVF
jgi:hypothetical protein